MNNVVLMLKISTVAIAVLIVILIVITALWIRAELHKRAAEERIKQFPCKIGDRVYSVGPFSCKNKDFTDKATEHEIFTECVKRKGKCDGCKYAMPAIEEYVCTQIQIAHDGIWICGAKAETHLASRIFTDKAQAEARLKELREGTNCHRLKKKEMGN